MKVGSNKHMPNKVNKCLQTQTNNAMNRALIIAVLAKNRASKYYTVYGNGILRLFCNLIPY
jgi:hypothetical protein